MNNSSDKPNKPSAPTASGLPVGAKSADGESGAAHQKSNNRRRRHNRHRDRRRPKPSPDVQAENEGTPFDTVAEDAPAVRPLPDGTAAPVPLASDTSDGKEPAAEATPNPLVTEENEKEAVTPENTPEKEAETRLPTYEVVGIRFRSGNKMYYFDPDGAVYAVGDALIVDTARGPEYAVVAMENRTVPGKEIVLPLRKVLRRATPEDERRHEENLEKETEAFNLCLSRIEAHRLEMKLVDVEYTFDNSKLLFYFTSEGRVDFRELVKDLASVFRTRIELRQIGIRDEAKMMGGLGVCGRPFCCSSFLPDFVQVSIKMAKEQSLSLNSAKISGACGRLMCCLRYEYDTYVAESALTPKVDDIVETPEGEGIVAESLPLKGTVKVQLNKDPNSLHLYRREDVTVTGHMKKKKNGGKNEKDPADNSQKTEKK